MKITYNKKRYSWAERLMEIIEKSLKITHMNYQRWNIGAAGLRDDNKRVQFNSAYGVHIANETFITAMIAQEAIDSPLFSGAVIDEDLTNNIEKGIRYWKIDNERSYEYDKKKKLDLYIKRYEFDEKKWTVIDDDSKYPPVYIEAKRAHLFSASELPDISVSDAKDQMESIISDIKKFEKEKKVTNANFHLLVWGIHDQDKYSEMIGPKTFFDELLATYDKELKKTELNLFKTKWIPIKYESESLYDPPNKVLEYIWVSLIEVNFI